MTNGEDITTAGTESERTGSVGRTPAREVLRDIKRGPGYPAAAIGQRGAPTQRGCDPYDSRVWVARAAQTSGDAKGAPEAPSYGR